MAPGPLQDIIPQEFQQNGNIDSNIDGESIVISGMSGLFPMSRNVQEFANNLYDKVI